MAAMKTLEDAFVHELKDLLSAEKQILAALPKMAKATSNPELKAAFEEHLEVTEQQVERLKKVFELVGKPSRAEKCVAMEGLLEEGKKVMDEEAEPEVLDAMLIGAAQRVEHYEIAAYGTVATWAEQIGQPQAAKLLKQTLDEEMETDQKLSSLAEAGINQHAQAGEEVDEIEQEDEMDEEDDQEEK